MAFDASIERLMCIPQHDNYVAMTNRTVLLQGTKMAEHTAGQASLIGRLFKIAEHTEAYFDVGSDP